MNIDKTALSRAMEIARQSKMKAVHVNDKGEMFTMENLAALSVGGNPERYRTLTLAEADALLAKLEAPAEMPDETKETPGGGSQDDSQTGGQPGQTGNSGTPPVASEQQPASQQTAEGQQPATEEQPAPKKTSKNQTN